MVCQASTEDSPRWHGGARAPSGWLYATPRVLLFPGPILPHLHTVSLHQEILSPTDSLLRPLGDAPQSPRDRPYTDLETSGSMFFSASSAVDL